MISDLINNGPYPGNSWPNYGVLKGLKGIKSGRDLRHRHLVKGNPTYVCCWEVVRSESKLLRCIMPALTKKHHTSQTTKDKIIRIQVGKRAYAIPKKVAEQYRVDRAENHYDGELVSVDEVFKELNEKYTKAGALLKGLRARENLNQIEFAKLIHVTQANLSKMENGKRPIGKNIAKRLEQAFNVNYKYFLE